MSVAEGGDGGPTRLELTVARAARNVQCAGKAFVRSKALQVRGPSGAGGAAAHRSGSLSEPDFEDDIEYLRGLDPREWKQQDHYAVLGIASLRHKASDDLIKRAYRAKVLKHHPDKRRAQGESVVTDDDYFTCITRAYEILGTPVKRRSYDSVDPEFDDSLPTTSDLKDDFFETFTTYFETNARWSEKKNVPPLGDNSTPRENVEKFYNFWYDFESWREYSYLDEEEKEKGQDRDERRWIEKQNKAVRAKKKKEEMSRIRALVDLAYNNDPRIVRFKQEDKDKKLAAKRARQTAAQARKAEEEKQMKEAQLAKEIADREEKARAETLRLEREIMKKNMKKERKTFRDLCKSNNYYIKDDKETVDHMSAVEKICEVLKLVELQELNKDLPNGGRQKFVDIMTETENRLEEERKAQLETQKDSTKQSAKTVASGGSPKWTQELIQLLIKSVNFFPAGTNQRWEVVANFVNQHGVFDDSRRFSAKDVLSKAKDLQSSDFSKSSLKVAANQEAFDKFEKDKRKPANAVENTEISMSFEASKALVNGKPEQSSKPHVSNGETETKPSKPVEKQDDKKEDIPWNKTEQELLEQAIKTYPASTPERWDRIAECIPSRSKKECMKRFKELVDLVKAKKAAAQKGK